MARKVVVTLIDDYDGRSEAEETVTFALDGAQYEMDLSVSNAGELRTFFEQWTPHARKVGRTTTAKPLAKPAVDREQSAAIRTWARKNGFDVSTRGRIQSEVISAYQKANA
ncbi:Lsr2 family protein [Nocardia terpenica]|uniref:Nucleoid-associated protein Lsr2 n=1 Tax=Nocardia terpenica TaxID=455432 RepID=A0A164NHX2_9NOCA|nr:Lsr2 family protein [Nocardia terpenica]KZM74383.1 nucleoid-associated protein Lsr2 [Nocardia terpenica]MBF6059904.1 Lsr2 family protein [Nocardia terpenica]MBF6102555.1 Lsr2 family protein [Nocardia terpenica]MBF6111254.1 Lsr2 family protein [Nocardia terpenica]MBF6117385.1 Lsr2 family protein [Nocardia terpenica]